MDTLAKVTTHDITRFKQNATNNEEVGTSDIKKKLMETIETNQLIQLMKATNKEEKSPSEILNDAGFSVKDLTEGLKENANLYKERAEMEATKRSEVEDREKETRDQVYELKEKLFETTINQQMDKYHSAVMELIKKVDDKKEERKTDPMTELSNQIMLKLINDKVEDMSAQKTQNPMQSIFDSIEYLDALKSKFVPQQSEIPASSDRLGLEVYKLRLEDERERLKDEKRLKLDMDKHETMKHAINTIGTEIADSLGAFATAFSQMKQGNFMDIPKNIESQEPQQNTMKPVTYQCPQCQGLFMLPNPVSNATCPYCRYNDNGDNNDNN